MSEWNEILNEKDINELLDAYAGFHDAYIISLNYQSGVSIQGRMTYYNGIDRFELHMILQSPWFENAIELCFTGVRRLHIIGAQDNSTYDIYDEASIKFYDGLLPSEYMTPERVIVWADSPDFDANEISSHICEPDDTYVIAHALKWRFVENLPHKE